jgi:hypothetical protein
LEKTQPTTENTEGIKKQKENVIRKKKKTQARKGGGGVRRVQEKKDVTEEGEIKKNRNGEQKRKGEKCEVGKQK